mgnify:CR=1 FL=1
MSGMCRANAWHQGLGDPGREALGIALKQVAQRAAELELSPQIGSLEPISVTGILNDCPGWSDFSPHKHGNAEYTFIADSGNLDRLSLIGKGNQGNDTGSGKINKTQFPAIFVDSPSFGQGYKFQAGLQPLVILFGKSSQKQVLLRGVKPRGKNI